MARSSTIFKTNRIVSPNSRNRRLNSVASVDMPYLQATKSMGTIFSSAEDSCVEVSELQRNQNVVQEEKRELYAQLGTLRKRFDKQKQRSVLLKHEYEKYIKEIERMERYTDSAHQESEDIQKRICNANEELLAAKQRIEKEVENKKIYENMKLRLSQEKLSSDFKTHSLTKTYEDSKSAYNINFEKSLKAEQTRHESKKLLREVHKGINREKFSQQLTIDKLEFEVNARHGAHMRRDEAEKIRATILETASRSAQQAKDAKKKVSYVSHKLYYDYLCKKLVRKQEKNAENEKTFSKLKLFSGMNEPEEIIEAYITKDDTHQLLMEQIKEAEVNLDNLQDQFRFQSQRLITARMMNSSSGDHQVTQEELPEAQKKRVDARERLNQTELTYGEMKRWGQQMLSRLTDDSVEGTLQNIFERLHSAVQENTQLVMEAKELNLSEIDKHGNMSPTKLIKNSDYNKKNIRINPMGLVRNLYTPESASGAEMSESDRMEQKEQREMLKNQAEILTGEFGRKYKRVKH